MAHKRSAFFVVSVCLSALAATIATADAEALNLLCVKTDAQSYPDLPGKLTIEVDPVSKTVDFDLRGHEIYTNRHLDAPTDGEKRDETACRKVRVTFVKLLSHYIDWGEHLTITSGCAQPVNRYDRLYDLDEATGTLQYFASVHADALDTAQPDATFDCRKRHRNSADDASNTTFTLGLRRPVT